MNQAHHSLRPPSLHGLVRKEGPINTTLFYPPHGPPCKAERLAWVEAAAGRAANLTREQGAALLRRPPCIACQVFAVSGRWGTYAARGAGPWPGILSGRWCLAKPALCRGRLRLASALPQRSQPLLSPCTTPAPAGYPRTTCTASSTCATPRWPAPPCSTTLASATTSAQVGLPAAQEAPQPPPPLPACHLAAPAPQAG